MHKDMTGTRLIATFFGAGLLRPAPGTWGSVAALPVAWLLHVMGGFWALALGTAVVFLLGWYVTIQETRGQSDPDPSEIVIDEVAGMWLALWPVSLGAMMQGVSITALWPGWIVAFLAFRAFDIWKPGPVGVAEHLQPFLPISRVVRRRDNTFILDYDFPKSIGYIAPFYGNFLVCLRACAYILTLGGEGLRQASDHAVLNANYLMHNLRKIYDLPFDRACMHEFVLSARKLLKQHDIRAADVAKGLIDQGFHPPTIYFPLIVSEAMMIEPTEVESKETLDRFIEAMRLIAEKAVTDPDSLRHAPFTTPVGRPDEVKAAREMDLAFHPDTEK